MAKKKHLDKQHAIKSKANEKYFIYRKKDYYAKNYHLSSKKKPKKLIKKVKYTQWKRNQGNKAVAAMLTTNHNDFDIKLYLAGRIFITCTVSAGKK